MQVYDDVLGGPILARTTQKEVDFAFSSGPGLFTDHQRNYIQSHFPFSMEVVATVKQVHGKRIKVVRHADESHDRIGEADGLITDIPQRPIGIRTADCLPVFMYDPEHRAIGLVHAGWKGSRQRIVARALDSMQRHYRTEAKDVRVVLGPGIRQCCYQVSEVFKRYFPRDIIWTKRGYYCSLSGINRRQLNEAGVAQAHIHDSNVCTCCDATYFSYRREGLHAGRMLSIMMIKGGSDADNRFYDGQE